MTTTRVINYNNEIYIDVMYNGNVQSVLNASNNYAYMECELIGTHETICRYGDIMQVIDCFDNMRPEFYNMRPEIERASCYEHDWDANWLDQDNEDYEPSPYDGTYSEV